MTDLHDRLETMLRSNGSSPIILSDNVLSRPDNYADENLTLQFSDQHHNHLKYVDTWGRWLAWDGTRWRMDDTLLTIDYTRTFVRHVSKEILDADGNKALAKAISSAKTISAIERLARADRRHAMRTEDWDSDPWLLNTPDGTVDLRTGKLRPHNQEDLMTKLTAVGPGGSCPKWLSFLNQIFNGDQELIGYSKRLVGYSLTGSIKEQALFFWFGTGGNGKGVTLGTLHGILGDYSVIAPMSTFVDSKSDRHPTELAMLRGSRLVTAQETEEGQPWAESKIKALTGGDPITARFMRQDFFTFLPSFKLIIAGNHKPSLRHVDEAIRRRFNLVPFTVTIPADQQDRNLADKLKEEWPGILAWAIDGCLEWQRIGLSPPPAVIQATENYLGEEDAIGRFIAERCERHPQALEELKDLYKAYKEFCELSGDAAVSQKSFSQKLEGQRLTKGNDSRTRRVRFQGIRLRPKIDEDAEEWA